MATQAWLTKAGISSQLVHTYLKGGWIERIGRGAYVRAGETVKWKGMVYSLQKHAHQPVWPGGQTALAMQGYAQYLYMGREMVYLFGMPGNRLPTWVGEGDWGATIEYRAPALFDIDSDGVQGMGHLDVSAGTFGSLFLTLSSMERAVFEMLHYVKDEAQFGHAAEILQGLVNLRPGVMQLHLEQCRSIKTKRLVMFFGEHFRQPWYAKVDQSRIDLGSGKRQIVKGGALNRRFEITVPRNFAGGA